MNAKQQNEEVREIPRQLSELDSVIGRVQEAFALLQGDLESVLSQAVETVNVQIPAPRQDMPSSKIGRHLDVNIDSLRSLLNNIHELRQRIQL